MAEVVTRYTVAAVQAAPIFMDLDASIEKSIRLIAQAAQAGAKLIAFPENFLPGYPWFVWLGATAWAMPFLAKYRQHALVIGSEQYQRLERAAAEYQIHVIMGFTERDAGSLYISQAIITDEGKTIATRRKLKPSMMERTVFGEGDGSDIAVHNTSLGKVGALCCWEHLQPLAKYAMYSQHEQLHIGAWPSFSLYKDIAHAISGEVNIAISRTYAVEGQCYVIAPCAIVSQDMIDLMCDTEERQQLLKAGGGWARIFGPDGSQLGTPLGENEEGLLFADVDLALSDMAKISADPVGHYSRKDVTQLIFNSQSLRGVHAWPEGAAWENTEHPEEE
ncbi:TPA: carbon-nitrogen hydrolase family protein [Klebsiella quasipneumoniae subsp. quasipneumoniae]|uniref:carbon-nitrogen hydrolase family protein n=1 Tax=Klebsiella TaxID=570 RepID=UPI000E2D58E5|nr:carbon-nitrogen hydrolase family protein [Klebsiella quasipneumoniae]EKZ5680232.1 carbon-nitrogen hydrolase family protein [Klebsiella quasipneumoniae]EMF1935360.1 carbon-nitrogen hydrolase family protein [Klebsiella quasipneumoniae]MDV5431154.1 carbon-nitrogen hydrolase family protein [Klebsiella quasipneumoniae]MDZ2010764.1 carbon-nitrogen hydrolase family protein [Klebsiella quasipneumoniae]SXD40524.1 carbon-nitrogen hydrolase [Klebsiella quasipneumoniae]